MTIHMAHKILQILIRGKNMNIFEIKRVYPEFVYPNEYLKLMKHDFVDFGEWYFMTRDQVEKRIAGLKKRYPKRKLVPFARRDDNDDIACFEMEKGGAVQIIHDFASSGYEQRKEFTDICSWLQEVTNNGT